VRPDRTQVRRARAFVAVGTPQSRHSNGTDDNRRTQKQQCARAVLIKLGPFSNLFAAMSTRDCSSQWINGVNGVVNVAGGLRRSTTSFHQRRALAHISPRMTDTIRTHRSSETILTRPITSHCTAPANHLYASNYNRLADSVGGPEKAGGGGSIPSLAHLIKINSLPSHGSRHSQLFLFQR